MHTLRVVPKGVGREGVTVAGKPRLTREGSKWQTGQQVPGGLVDTRLGYPHRKLLRLL